MSGLQEKRTENSMKKLLTIIAILALALSIPSQAIAATLGYTTIGSNTFQAGTINGTNNPVGLLITVPGSGTITKITAHVIESVSSGSLTAKIYSGSAGSRGALISTTNGATVTTTFGWVDFIFATPVSVSATTYWIEFSGDGGGGPGTNVASIKYDTGGAANSAYDVLDNSSVNYETNQYSIYATYTATPASTAVTTDIRSANLNGNNVIY